jgi:hypothetical protein
MSRWHVARALVPAAPGLIPALASVCRNAFPQNNEFRAFSEESSSLLLPGRAANRVQCIGGIPQPNQIGNAA